MIRSQDKDMYRRSDTGSLLLANIILLVSAWLVSGQKPHVTCRIKHKKIGCFNQDSSHTPIFSDRSLATASNKGYLIDWNNWEQYMHSLACRCNDDAKKLGFRYFQLRYYGLCLGSKEKPAAAKVDSSRCLGPVYQPCVDSAATECVGAADSDYVYEVGRDGGYTDWGSFSVCSASCGGGTKIRTRNCSNPTPTGLGKNCSLLGTAQDTQICNGSPCSVDGNFSSWSPFESCSKSCGGGIMTRHRRCDNPAPSNGGKGCLGPTAETKACNNNSCPVDGGFSSWTEFGACSRTCGEGVTIRQRYCNNPSPAHGGMNCSGHLIDRKSCLESLCAGPDGVSEAQEIITKFLLNFHKDTYPYKGPSGKFYRALNAITKATAEEFASANKNISLQNRMDDLLKFLKVATEGGSINFARTTLGRSLFLFMKKKIEEGLPYGEVEKGAKGYLESIKKDIGATRFDEIMLENGDATLMFVIDTSSSMADEIDSAKAIASSIIDMKRDFPVDYILSPFNDPVYGPVTYKNATYKKGFINAINSLVLTGGLDCPELAFTGIIEALKAEPKLGSPMFVFTDASAKDDSFEKKQELKAAADRYSTRINFFSNPYGCGDAKGIKSFEEIAAYTSGQTFPLKNHAELRKFKDYIEESMQSDTVIAQGSYSFFGRRKKRQVSLQKTYTIHVDTEITKLSISLNVNQRNTAKMVKLVDHSGKEYKEQSFTTYTKVYDIKNPTSATWSLIFPIRTGKGSFVAKVVQKRFIEVSHHFLHQESSGNNSPLLMVTNPLQGKQTTMVIQISNTDLLDTSSLQARITDANGKSVMGIAIKGVVGSFKASILPPSGKLKIEVNGRTKNGEAFQRLSPITSETQNIIMAAVNAGQDFTVSVSKGISRIEVYLYNHGDTDNFNFKAEASYGSLTVDLPLQTLAKAKNATIGFDYNPSSNAISHIGKTDVVKIKATGRSSTQISVSVLIVP